MALQQAHHVGFKGELLSEKAYRTFHDDNQWQLQGLDLPNKVSTPVPFVAQINLDENLRSIICFSFGVCLCLLVQEEIVCLTT